MTEAAIATLQQRAEDLGDRLKSARNYKNDHERRDLRRAREALQEQEEIAGRKAVEIARLEKKLAEVNRGINVLRNTRPIADTPQA